mmetsp:Transcript_39824/g.101006  ORF Transcript_39824/g.101006 Transcript_39824/m.101006 type:complete len:252 (+) Transcript_39824:685-1440(+)
MLTHAGVLAKLACLRHRYMGPKQDKYVPILRNVVRESAESGLPDIWRAANAAHRKHFAPVVCHYRGEVPLFVIDLVWADGLAVEHRRRHDGAVERLQHVDRAAQDGGARHGTVEATREGLPARCRRVRRPAQPDKHIINCHLMWLLLVLRGRYRRQAERCQGRDVFVLHHSHGLYAARLMHAAAPQPHRNRRVLWIRLRRWHFGRRDLSNPRFLRRVLRLRRPGGLYCPQLSVNRARGTPLHGRFGILHTS